MTIFDLDIRAEIASLKSGAAVSLRSHGDGPWAAQLMGKATGDTSNRGGGDGDLLRVVGV